jgi:hypothetical protein
MRERVKLKTKVYLCCLFLLYASLFNAVNTFYAVVDRSFFHLQIIQIILKHRTAYTHLQYLIHVILLWMSFIGLLCGVCMTEFIFMALIFHKYCYSSFKLIYL